MPMAPPVPVGTAAPRPAPMERALSGSSRGPWARLRPPDTSLPPPASCSAAPPFPRSPELSQPISSQEREAGGASFLPPALIHPAVIAPEPAALPRRALEARGCLLTVIDGLPIGVE